MQPLFQPVEALLVQADMALLGPDVPTMNVAQNDNPQKKLSVFTKSLYRVKEKRQQRLQNIILMVGDADVPASELYVLLQTGLITDHLMAQDILFGSFFL